jgi:HlyD family secretion protein
MTINNESNFMSKKKLIIIISSVLVALLVISFSMRSKSEEPDFVTVEKGTIKDQAIAMGALIPRNVVNIKSRISGIVGHISPNEGSFVEKGDRLIEIQPEPTPREYVEARQAVDLAELEENYRDQELKRLETMKRRNLVSEQEFDAANDLYQQSILTHRLAKEKLQLLEDGKANVAGKMIESTLFSPISGYVLANNVSEGDSVVPLTDNQDGTILMTLADMNDLVFKGTVDQIDIGRIQLDQPVEIQVGAIPDILIKGKVDQISLQASNFDEDLLLKGEQTAEMKFKVEVQKLIFPMDMKEITWRSGYSAVANILVSEALETLLLPERVIEFENDSPYVNVMTGRGVETEKRKVTLGISDGVKVQILDGVKEGDRVLEVAQS